MSKRDYCSKNFVKLDAFGAPFQFTLPDQSKIFKTVPGAICTIAMVLVIMVFASYKVSVLIERSQYRLL